MYPTVGSLASPRSGLRRGASPFTILRVACIHGGSCRHDITFEN